MLNWGESSIWTNDDFEQLSEKIFEKTRVQLSVSTLKRIWGKVRYENFPTNATLNALSGFLGYENWRDFRQKQETTAAVNDSDDVSVPAVFQNTPIAVKTKTSAMKVALPIVLVIVLLIFFRVKYISSKKYIRADNISNVIFKAIKITDTLPNSVVFSYDASAFKSDSVYIQQSWDPKRRERVAANGRQYTSIYYNPGYFIAKLVVDNQVKKECIVSIKTRGWKGIIETAPIPIYLSATEIKGKGFMGISDSLLRTKTPSPVNNTWVKFANVTAFKGIDAGNFTLESTFRNASSVEASICRKANVVVLGAGGAIVIPFSDKGCISDLNILTGDNYISGKEHDMSAFGCDFSQFQDLRCTVGQHRLKIYLNRKLIFEIPQKITLGKIEGLRFEFEGSGQVKQVKLSTPGGGVYEDKF